MGSVSDKASGRERGNQEGQTGFWQIDRPREFAGRRRGPLKCNAQEAVGQQNL